MTLGPETEAKTPADETTDCFDAAGVGLARERREAGADAEEDSGSFGSTSWRPLPRSKSVASEIVINFTVVLLTALALTVIFVNFTYSMFTEKTALHYAPYFIIPYILIFGVTVVVFGLRLVSKTTIRPLHEVLDAMHRIAKGDLTQRVPVTELNELGQLASAFNEMTEEIELGRRELLARLSETRRLNESLARTQSELLASEKLASVGRLAAGVAHEIGNPLASISGYLELIARRDYLRAEEREMIARVRREVDRINGIIRELLDYSRPQDDTLAALNLNELIDSTLTLTRAQKSFDRIEVDTRLEALPKISANRSSLKQLLMNLIINAAQAMPAGGKLTVTTRPAQLEGRDAVELSVADTGGGIHPDHLEKIFDPFFTTKEPGQGTGLGLSICQRIVENLEGRIRVESEHGRGATFFIKLPVTTGPLDEPRPTLKETVNGS